MQGGEKIGESGELLEEVLPRSFPDCPANEVGERCAVTELLNQYVVETGIVAKRPGDIMRIAGQTDAAQMVEILEFSHHVLKGGIGGTVCDIVKKLSDNPSLAVTIFVEVDMIRRRDPVDPKIRRSIAEAELRKNIVTEIPIEWVIFGQMADIVHPVPL